MRSPAGGSAEPAEETTLKGTESKVTGKRAWLLLFGLVAIYEVTAPPGELLSEEVDRQLEAHRWLTILFGLVTVAHLYNLLPNRIDPYHWLVAIANR